MRRKEEEGGKEEKRENRGRKNRRQGRKKAEGGRKERLTALQLLSVMFSLRSTSVIALDFHIRK